MPQSSFGDSVSSRPGLDVNSLASTLTTEKPGVSHELSRKVFFVERLDAQLAVRRQNEMSCVASRSNIARADGHRSKLDISTGDPINLLGGHDPQVPPVSAEGRSRPTKTPLIAMRTSRPTMEPYV
jgi:hypothetical protein